MKALASLQISKEAELYHRIYRQQNVPKVATSGIKSLDLSPSLLLCGKLLKTTAKLCKA